MNSDPRFAYRQGAAHAASPVGRVILLYEQVIQDLGAAAASIASNDVEQKTNKLGHALLVIGQLQACLDLERGGEVARNLDRFYYLVRQSLLEAQIKSSASVLRQQVELLLSVRAAWMEVEQQERQGAKPAPASPGNSPIEPASNHQTASRWRA